MLFEKSFTVYFQFYSFILFYHLMPKSNVICFKFVLLALDFSYFQKVCSLNLLIFYRTPVTYISNHCWSRYMSLITKPQEFSEFNISMLPIIDLHATDPTVMHSLLLFVEKQCKKWNLEIPCVTIGTFLTFCGEKYNFNLLVQNTSYKKKDTRAESVLHRCS